jgi:hypothetical protein
VRVIFTYICVLFLMSACDYFPNMKKVEGDKGRPIAKVYEKVLYEYDLDKQLPSGLSELDSVIFAKSYINSWAKDQLLLHQAEFNLTDKSVEFENLVKDYRSTLYINAYKEALVLSKLDTAITHVQIQNYYSENGDNFKLNEELVRLKFIHTDSGRNDRKELVKLFKSQKKEDINELHLRGLEFRSFNLNDSIWIKYNDVISKIEGLRNMEKNKILKKSNFIQKEDSLGLYLVTVKEVLKRNDIAPMSYITPTIKQIILQKRKLELLRKIEVDLLNDAIKKQYFEEY